MNDLALDHVVIAVADLETATSDYVALLGRAPSWRGSHPQYGTRNTLFRIDNTYLELLAPDRLARSVRLAGAAGALLQVAVAGQPVRVIHAGAGTLQFSALPRRCGSFISCSLRSSPAGSTFGRRNSRCGSSAASA